jgi:hypothetical protein
VAIFAFCSPTQIFYESMEIVNHAKIKLAQSSAGALWTRAIPRSIYFEILQQMHSAWITFLKDEATLHRSRDPIQTSGSAVRERR